MRGLEELDGITGWIVHYELLAAPTLNDVAAHGYASLLQFLGVRGKIGHFKSGSGSSHRARGLGRPASPGLPRLDRLWH
jgi:hypothetical protein